MRARRYVHEDGGLEHERNGWNQFAAQDAGRAAGERRVGREWNGGGYSPEDREHGNGAGNGGKQRGSHESKCSEPERGGIGLAGHGYVGRAADQGRGAEVGNSERNVQRLVERRGGQDGGVDAEVELAGLLTEATGALARLDADALGELEERAQRLQALLTAGARIATLREIAARHRVFAGVVQATAANLGILERTRKEGTPWAR